MVCVVTGVCWFGFCALVVMLSGLFVIGVFGFGICVIFGWWLFGFVVRLLFVCWFDCLVDTNLRVFITLLWVCLWFVGVGFCWLLGWGWFGWAVVVVWVLLFCVSGGFCCLIGLLWFGDGIDFLCGLF